MSAGTSSAKLCAREVYLLTVNGSVPRSAVFGRAPPMLLCAAGATDAAEASSMGRVARLRVSVSSKWWGGTAKAILQRAWASRGALVGPSHEYRIGCVAGAHCDATTDLPVVA